MPARKSYEVIIIGGGPAGLNAAVVLGRCRRKVILFDSARPRNRLSQGIHNYLTRDDILPRDFLQIAAAELRKYGVPRRQATIISARRLPDGFFLVRDQFGTAYTAIKLVIATGVIDKLPSLAGIEKFYGRSVFHCPYCDAWEMKDKRIGVYSEKKAIELALSLKTWTASVSYFTNGGHALTSADKKLLKQYGIALIPDKILKLSGKNGELRSVELEGKKSIPCEALFFATGYIQHSDLAEQLGCKVNDKQVLVTSKSGRTNIPGLYVVGDASWDMHLVVIAAAEGAKAGVFINKQLQSEERKRITGIKNGRLSK